MFSPLLVCLLVCLELGWILVWIQINRQIQDFFSLSLKLSHRAFFVNLSTEDSMELNFVILNYV